MNISIKPHAIQQYIKRGGLTPPSISEIRGRLISALRAGAEFSACSVKIDLWNGFVAVCVPEIWGGWSVVTIYREGDEVKDIVICPRCEGQAHEVFYGDGIKRWRCMKCESVFSETVWEKQGDELLRRRSWGISSKEIWRA